MAETLYEHAGGDEVLHHLEELFYDKALADPLLASLFTERRPTHVDHLTWFTADRSAARTASAASSAFSTSSTCTATWRSPTINGSGLLLYTWRRSTMPPCPATNRSERQSASTLSSAPTSRNRTHGRKTTPSCTRSAKCLSGAGLGRGRSGPSRCRLFVPTTSGRRFLRGGARSGTADSWDHCNSRGHQPWLVV